jgi:exosortase D (VPLPA-CTERM-specific)
MEKDINSNKVLYFPNLHTSISFALYSILLIGIYHSSHALMIRWWRLEDYNYCYLIPIVVLYLIWDKRYTFNQTSSMPDWFGLTPLVFGIVLFWLGELGGEYYSMYLSSWFVLFGICWMNLGWHKLKIILFPITFILTMFPPPSFIYNNLSLKLKLISSKIGVNILQFFGISAYREGNVIDLGFTQLQVVDACSGLRYLIPLIVLAILVAYFSKAALWKKIVLVLSAIPISIFVNSFRIATVGMLYPTYGPKVAEGFFHDFSGWLIFMLSLLVLMGELALLNRLFGRSKDDCFNREVDTDSFSPSKTSASVNRTDYDESGVEPYSRLYRPHFIVSVILLGATLALAQGIEFREKVPTTKPFHLFPLQIGEWSGKKFGLEQEIVEELDFSDYITVEYVNPKQRMVSFYTAFYESQSKGESIHSPESCLPGGGWVTEQSGPYEMKHLTKNQSMKVNRTLIRNGDNRQLVYYWFPCRGRILTNLYQLKLYTFWDALTHQRTDGALVRVLTPVYPAEKLHLAEQRLQGFVRQIVPLLNEFLPQ